MKIYSFSPAEWLRSLRPWLCGCGHMRSAHAHHRGACGRCTCTRPRRATRWSMLSIGYRLGLEAGRLTAPVSTVTVLPGVGPFDAVHPADELETHWPTGHALDPPTVRLESLARLEESATDGEAEHGPGVGGPW